MEKIDNVNHPEHYKPRFNSKGLQCRAIAERLPFCLGNAFKYVWRAGDKGDYAKCMEDLDKALNYLKRAKEVGDYAKEDNLKVARVVWDVLQPEDTARWHVLDYLLYPHMTEPEATWWKKLKAEVSEEALTRAQEESLYNKMNKVLQLYKGYSWACDTALTTDAGGEQVPSTSVTLGAYMKDREFSPLVVDFAGKELGLEATLSKIPEGAYIAGDWSMEASPEEVMTTICDELLKRKEGK